MKRKPKPKPDSPKARNAAARRRMNDPLLLREVIRAAVQDHARLDTWSALDPADFPDALALAEALRGELADGLHIVRAPEDRGKPVEGTVIAFTTEAGVAIAEPCTWIPDALAGAAVKANGLSALAVVVEALPQEPNRRLDPLLPAITGGALAPERERGLLFGGLIPDPPARNTGTLPLFPARPEAMILRAPLLAMADAAGRPIMAKGRGAPLDFRLPVEAMLAVDEAARWRDKVRIAWRVRDLRDAMFPRDWKPTRKDRPGDWEALRGALLAARDLCIPMPEGSPVRYWYPFHLVGEPGSRYRSLDDLVVADVAIPPGSGTGPPIDRPELRLLGVDSGPRYRAYIAVHTANWVPGRTQRKVRGRWFWSTSRADYPVFTHRDLRELAFGLADRRNRTRAAVEAAWEGLPGTRIIGKREADLRTGARGWRIVPEAAAEAILQHKARSRGRRK